METEKTPYRLPNWAVIAIAIIVGLTVYYFSTRSTNEPAKVIKTAIEAKTAKRDGIITEVKNNSTQAVKRGDSLVELLKHEPWKLSQQDMKDSAVVNFLKNYRYEE